MDVHNTMDQYSVTNPYGLFRRSVNVLVLCCYYIILVEYAMYSPEIPSTNPPL